MTVLSKAAIKKRMKLDIADEQSIIITPLLNEDSAFDAEALDLRLGSYFLLPRISGEGHFCPDDQPSNARYQSVHIPLGRYIVIPAHQTILGATLEYIKLPFDVSGQILTKSSVARTFVVMETAPWIHPSYRGCLTLEIANVSNTPILLYPGRPIGQLVFFAISPKPDRKQKLNATYLGPIYPEAPRFNSPQKDLSAIGITQTWVIPSPRPAPSVK
jgi:dCTP deaminase